LHSLHEEARHLYTHTAFPLCDQPRHKLPELPAIPLFQYIMSLLLISSRAHLEQHAVALQLYRWRVFTFGNLEKITLSPNVMAFPVQIFPLRLPILSLQLPLLLLDPTQLEIANTRTVSSLIRLGAAMRTRPRGG